MEHIPFWKAMSYSASWIYSILWNWIFIVIFFYFKQMHCASFIILYNEPTNAQLIDKLLYSSYMLRHYCVILRELVASALLSYTSMWHW